MRLFYKFILLFMEVNMGIIKVKVVEPAVAEFNAAVEEINNPKEQPDFYLRLAKENFKDFELRQIYFFTAKQSIKKYYPQNYPEVDPLRSEKLSIKQLNNLIDKYSHKG